MKYLGSLDIGGTKTMVGVVDSSANILVKKQFATNTTDCYTHFDACSTQLIRCLSEINLSLNDLEGIGVNMPGLVDVSTGSLLQAPFAGWYNVDVKGYFCQLFGTDRIVVENDVNACAIGELIFGNACDNFLWATVSTGIGGAIIIDRKLAYGYNSCAGELGHVKVEYENPIQCCCGQWGCVEAHGSGTAITRMFSEEVYKDAHLAKICTARNFTVDAKKCAFLAKEGNQKAIEIFNTAGKYIGRALSYAANLLNPQKIYIGGGVSNSIELFLPALRKEFDRATLKHCAGAEIVKTALAYDAALMGAAALVLTNK